MKCIDFDKEFQRYLSAWLQKHSKEYKNYDELEAKARDIYEEFLAEPVAWLGGKCPGEYFEQFDSARLLVNHLEDYFKQRVPVPDMLMNRIAQLGAEAEPLLFALLTKERAPQEAKMSAIELLREIGSMMPIDLYVKMIASQEEIGDELAENALESLDSLGELALPAMREALPGATWCGQYDLCSLLCRYEDPDEQVFNTVMMLLEEHSELAATLADYLAKLGNEKALEPLKKIAASDETGYLDYIELRSAIEALGGDAPEREFDESDPGYEAMRMVQDRAAGVGTDENSDPGAMS